MEKKVLIADSSSVCLEIEHELLRKLPVKVFSAGYGKDALELARKLRPDLICMGLDLGWPDGAECCRAVKADAALAATLVILLASPTERELAACRKAGCDALLAKPIDRREFIAVCKSFLDLNEQQEERIPCRVTVTCRLEKNVFCGTLEDISRSGMFVGSHCEVRVGERLTLKFLLPVSGASTIETGARVVWINGGRSRRKGDLPVGFGVVFEELDKGASEQIAAFVERSILWEQQPSEW